MPHKIAFALPDEDFENLALYSASQDGAPSPGPFMREISKEFAKKGQELRNKLNHGNTPSKQPRRKAAAAR